MVYGSVYAAADDAAQDGCEFILPNGCVALTKNNAAGACESCGTRNVGVADHCAGCGAALDPVPLAHTRLVGEEVSGYRLVEELGRGSMGSVYAADAGCDDSRGPFALKLLHPHLTSDPLRVKRFQREAQAAMALDHPAIVRLVEFGEDETHGPFMVMERLRGQSLLQRSQALTFEEVCQVFEQVLDALAHAHARGIIHRDLKAENVVVSRNHDAVLAKVCDFGMVKMLEDEGTAITADGLVCGTPEYMSPEQARGDELDGRSDVYAVGCLLFLVLTGRLPFRGSTVVDTLGQQLARPVPSACRAAPKRMIPMRLDAVARRAMAKTPDDRYQSASDMRAAILDAAQQLHETPLNRKQHGRWFAVLLTALLFAIAFLAIAFLASALG